MLGTALIHVQDLVLEEFYGVHLSSAGPLLKIRLGDIPSYQCASCNTQLGVVDKIAEGALKLIVHNTNKMPEDN